MAWKSNVALKNSWNLDNLQYLLFDSSSDLFSAPTIIDFFTLKNCNTLSITKIQNFLESGTYESMNAIHQLTLNPDSTTLFNLDLFFNSSSFDVNLIQNSQLLNFSEGLISELQFLSSPKNDALEMLNVFPQYTSAIEVFEILSCNIDNSLYENLSTPDFKLYYPEPFIASPSFIHEDLWFIHILHYQHWLWFFFISLIMFFFITFINVVRWCNPRNKPRKETRGVSRSKCADLITACVPVSWATSIIISESVDAADYYDGFGTGEIVVGIRVTVGYCSIHFSVEGL
jgi:hypothetical protein